MVTRRGKDLNTPLRYRIIMVFWHDLKVREVRNV